MMDDEVISMIANITNKSRKRPMAAYNDKAMKKEPIMKSESPIV